MMKNKKYIIIALVVVVVLICAGIFACHAVKTDPASGNNSQEAGKNDNNDKNDKNDGEGLQVEESGSGDSVDFSELFGDEDKDTNDTQKDETTSGNEGNGTTGSGNEGNGTTGSGNQGNGTTGSGNQGNGTTGSGNGNNNGDGQGGEDNIGDLGVQDDTDSGYGPLF